MNYFLLITDAKGESRIVPVDDVNTIPVEPGDDVVVMDEKGNPVDVSLRPEGEDLIIDFGDGTKAILEDFYNTEEGDEPITISLNPVEPIADEYEFNSQTGNLPNSRSFTLMRFSNTEYVEFVEQLDDLNVGHLLNGLGQPRLSGLGGGECCEDEVLDPVPVAAPDAASGLDGTTIVVDLLSNDTDSLGEGLSIHSVGGIGVAPGSSVTLPSGSVVTVNANGTVDFQPGPNFDALQDGESGVETFLYSIRDAGGNIATSQVSVTVAGINDPPVANPDEFELTEDAPITVDVLNNDSDPDTSDTLTVTGVDTPPSGTIMINGDNTLTFDPAGSFESLAVGETATVTLSYEISDDRGATATSTVTFVVNGENDAPDAMDDAAVTDQGLPVTIDVLTNDVDLDTSDTLTVTGVTQPTSGAVIYNSGDVTFNPGSEFDYLDAGESATVTFSYDISDGNGGTDTATVTVTVNGVDDATVTNPDAGITNEDTPVTIDVLANDSDVDTSDNPLMVGAITQPTDANDGTVVNNGTDVTFTPGSNFNSLAVGESATTTFTYTTDTGITDDVTVTVHGVNDAPAAMDDADVTDQDTPITVDVLANDTDPDASDALIISGVDQPAKGSASVNSDSEIVFDPGSDFEDLDAGESATVTFDYTISDGNGGSDTATVTITVNGVDDATVTNPDVDITDEDTAVTIDVLANDSDVDSSDNPLMVGSITQPTDANDGLVVNNGTDVTFTPGSNFNSLAAGESATTTFTYTTDTGVTENVTVTINGVNDGPAAVDDADSTDQNTAITIDAVANDTDPDSSDVLLITGVDQPAKGSASVDSNNQIVFDPGSDFDDLDAGESATVTFDYNISDGNGGTDTATVTITVDGVDDATVTNPDVDITDEDTAVTIDVLANDSDVDASDNPLMVGSVTQPTDANDGLVVNNATDVTFTPGSNFNSLAVGESATTTFTYTTDTGVTENVTVTVNGVNDAPAAVDDADSTDQDTAITVDVLANDTDPDASDALIISGVDQPAKGSASVNSNSEIVFDPGSDFDDLDAGESATVTFDYTISDGNGGSDTATVTITVDGVDDATVTNPDVDITDEDTAVIIDVLANDSDVDASDNPLMVGSVTQPTDANDGLVVNNGTDVTFTPGSNFNSLAVGESATTTFTYTTDTGVTENVTVTVNGVNDGPAAVDDADSTDQDTPITIDVVANDTDPDTSDVLLIAGVGQPNKGSASIDENNQIVFDPGSDFDDLDAGESATVTFDYNISDGNGGTDTATVTITVNGVDDATVTNPDVDITDEDTAVTIDVLANDSDVDSSDNPLMVGSITQPTDANDGLVVNNGTDVTFTPGSNFNSLAVGESATTTFTYTTDTGVTENVTVTVNGVNDGPAAVDDADSTDQNTAITIDAVANDTDPDTSDVLLITGVDQPVKGSASVDSNNQIVFDPGSDFDDLDTGESATVTFDYNISDGNGGTDTATVTITVNGVDDATVTNPDVDITDEDTAVTIDVLANDSDVDSSDNPLMVGSITQPTDANDGLVVNNGTDVTFTPGSNFNSLAVGESATTTFTYTTDTGVTENVTVTVNGVNDAPAAVDDADSTDQDTPITVDVLANDTDPDASDALTISGVDQPTKGSATVNSNSEIVFDPGSDFDDLDAGESATVTFDYTISDGNGGSDTATVTITVNGVDDATVTNPDVDITDEDTAVTIDVLANDSDADSSDNPLMVGAITQPTDANDGTVVNNGTDVTFTPGSNFNSLAVGESATTTFTYTTDTGVTENVTVTVNGVNDGPAAVDDADSTDQDTPITIDVVANDTDPDTSDVLLIAGVGQPNKGSASIDENNQIVFDPGSDFDDLDAGESATVTFDYNISDGNGGTDTATVTITVNGVDDATVTNPDVDITDEDTAVTIDVLANDSDADSSDNPLMVGAITQPTDANDGLVVNNGTDVTFTPGSNFNSLAVGESATTTFTYTTDTGVTENVTVTVNGVNDAPAAVDDADSTDQDTPITVDVLANDTDPDASDALIISGVDQPTKGSATVNSNSEIVFDPGSDFDDLDAGESATVTFDYTISDGNGGSDTATVTITVNGVDDATVTNPDVDITDEDTAVTIDVLANDSDADSSDNPLMVGAITQPTDANDGTVVNNGTDVTFTPGSNFNSLAVGESATTTFTYTTDTGVTENVTVTVNGVNDAPAAADDADVTDQDTPITVDVLTNDSDPDTSDALIISGVDQPAKGSTSVNSNSEIVFDPGSDFDDLDAGESETVTFDYTISDGNGGSDTATVTITVNGVDDATVTNPDADITNEDTAVTIDVLANDSDVDSSDNPLMVGSITQPTDANDGLVVNNGTDVTFTPGSNFNSLAVGESATTTFTYTTDTGVTENVTVTINGVNDGPAAMDDADVTDQNTAIMIDAVANDTDPDTSDVLLITGVDQPAKGSASVDSSNQIAFDPGSDFDDLDAGESATVTFDYNISDGNGGTATATVTVTVNGVDDATVTNPDADITDEDTAVTIDVLANDSDVDASDNPLMVGSITQPTDANDGLVVNNGTDVTFTPGSNFNSLAVGESATTTFTYTTNTGATETVTVTINGTDDALVASPDSGTTGENTPVTIDVLANDSDPDTADNPLVIDSFDTTTSGGGTVSQVVNDLVFDPGTDFDDLAVGETEVVTFEYTVANQDLATATETVTITVTGENDVPVANADLINTDRNEPVTFTPLANDPDVDGDTLTVTQIDATNVNSGDTVTLSSGALVTLNAGGTFTYDANGNYDSIRSGDLIGEDSFTYQVSDGNGGFDTATATVILTPQLLLANGALGYATPDSTAELYTFLPDTSTVPTAETTALSQIFDGEGMTMRPSTGMVIVFDDTTNGDLYQIDPNTGISSFIGATGIGDVQGASFFVDSMTLEETLYVIGNGGGDGGDEIFKVDPDTGVIDPNGFGPGVDRIFLSGDISALSSLTIDPSTGLGWGTDDNSSLSTYDGVTGNPDLYTVDLTTGNTTFVAGLPSGIDGESLAFAVDGKLYTEDEGSPNTVYEVNKTTGALTPASEWVGVGDVEGMAFNAFFNLFAPAVDLDSTTVGDNYTATFSGSPESVASFDSDLDSERTNEVIMATITLTNPQAGDELNIGTLPATITGGQTTDDSGQLVVTLYVTNGNTGTVADFEAAIEAITFDNSLASPNMTDRIIEVRIMDTDGTLSEPAIATLEIAATPPVVIDMDGDGVEFDGIKEGIAMDVDGDGELERTAWADEDDAVLVYDGNDNNDIDGLNEFAFARYSDDPNATDLEGLRHFDTNEDLILDANDAEFDSFKLWQDRDGDGTVDDGEMMTLGEAGIESLELVSDGEAYYTAGGDVLVHGEAGVNYADGSKGILADAEFQYDELAPDDDSLEVVADDGQVIDVNENGVAPEPVGEDLLAGDGGQTTGPDPDGAEAGAPPATSSDDDLAAADAAMS